MDGKISCVNCAHFYITWDRDFPRGCKALAFKAREMPSAVVQRSSGMECQSFKPKEREEGGGQGGAS